MKRLVEFFGILFVLLLPSDVDGRYCQYDIQCHKNNFCCLSHYCCTRKQFLFEKEERKRKPDGSLELGLIIGIPCSVIFLCCSGGMIYCFCRKRRVNDRQGEIQTIEETIDTTDEPPAYGSWNQTGEIAKHTITADILPDYDTVMSFKQQQSDIITTTVV